MNPTGAQANAAKPGDDDVDSGWGDDAGEPKHDGPKKPEAAAQAAPAPKEEPHGLVLSEPPPAEPSYEEPLAEDEADMTSIMDASQRRELQKAARSGDATAVKQAAEKIAAQRDGKLDMPTVPPPADASAANVKEEEKSTAPPPPGADLVVPDKIPEAKIPRESRDEESLAKELEAPKEKAPEPKPEVADEDESRPIVRVEPAAAAAAPAPAPGSPVAPAMAFNPWLVAVAVATIVFVIVLALAMR